MTLANGIWIAVVLWFATGWYMNERLKLVHRKLDALADQFDGLREYLYEIDPQFEEERRLRDGLFESVESGSSSFDGMLHHQLVREKRERGERTLNTRFAS